MLKPVHVLPSLFFPAKQTWVVPGGAIGSAAGFRIFGDRKDAGSKPARGPATLEFALRDSGKYMSGEKGKIYCFCFKSSPQIYIYIHVPYQNMYVKCTKLAFCVSIVSDVTQNLDFCTCPRHWYYYVFVCQKRLNPDFAEASTRSNPVYFSRQANLSSPRWRNR